MFRNRKVVFMTILCWKNNKLIVQIPSSQVKLQQKNFLCYSLPSEAKIQHNLLFIYALILSSPKVRAAFQKQVRGPGFPCKAEMQPGNAKSSSSLYSFTALSRAGGFRKS